MMFPTIERLIKTQFLSHELIPVLRKKELDKLAMWMRQELDIRHKLDGIVICTHNSRRSHLGQLMLALAADYYHLEGISVFSGGTEATAFNYRMINALSETGFKIISSGESDNPKYNISWGDSDTQTLTKMFSKPYNDKVNPQEHFLAILVCDSAAQNCPVVSGASKRVALTYRDPKDFDDTDQEDKAYIEKIVEMGREFFYLVQHIKNG